MKLERAIWSVAIAVFSLIAGFVAGGSLASRQNPPDAASDIDKAAQLQATLTKAVVSWRGRAEACEMNYQTATVLYEPGQQLSVPLLHGLVDLQAGPALGLPVNSGPHWIIPWKIVPRTLGNAQGFTYSYLDTKTERLDGPYLPAQLQQSDHWNNAGWISR
jgi:hypothetical protein